MRNTFAAELTTLASEDERIICLSADIGNRLFDDFKKRCPGRFFNCGVAEANTVGIAAGLALCGLRPVTYTIAAFMAYRCYEQIRVDICYHRLPVVIVGVGAGLSYAMDGPTHHSCEDLAALRVLPGLTIMAPADRTETRLALRAALNHDGPVYIRLGKKNEPDVHKQDPAFCIGKGIELRGGNDVCLLATGTIVPTALEASALLEKDGITARVVSMPTIKPLDSELLERLAGEVGLLVTVEEHSRLGGLGGSVAEWLSDHPELRIKLLRCGTPDAFLMEAGDQDHARARFGLTAESIRDQIRKVAVGR